MGAASDRNSGHVVQGHVDETGNILEFRPEGESLWVKISLSDSLLPYVVPKGYIAVDGTSLTVCEVNHVEKWFNLMLISHTQQCIIVPKKKVGERVNLEALPGQICRRSDQRVVLAHIRSREATEEDRGIDR